MRITISHNKSRDEAIRVVDASLEDLLKSVPVGGVQITDQKKQWTGSHMDFSLTARVSIITTPIRGTVDVSDQDMTLDINLPSFLYSLMPETRIRSTIENKVKGLLA